MTPRRFGVGRIAQTAGSALEPVAEDAVDRLLAGQLPEAFARSLIEHRVLDRVARELLASEEFQRSIDRALASEQADELVARLVNSPAFARMVDEAVSSPAVTHALTHRTATAGEELLAALRRSARRGDDWVERGPRRWVGRGARSAAAVQAGACTRGAALVLDVLLVQLVFLIVAGTVGLVLSLTFDVGRGWTEGLLAGIGWIVLQAAYFGGFWSAAGRTPGMTVLGVSVRTRDGNRPSLARALVRLAGLWVAVAVFFLGLVPVLFDNRRRALQDFLAGTEILYDVRPRSSGAGEVLSPAPS
jgi:uncharacterized RDD family membrane protein YckC